MTHHLPPVCRLLDHGLVPELLRHGDEAQRGKETVRFFKHLLGCPALGREQTGSGEGQRGMRGVPEAGEDGRPRRALFLWAGEVFWGQLELDPALGISRWGENTDEPWRFLVVPEHLTTWMVATAKGCWVPRSFPRAAWKSTDLLFHGWCGIHLGGIRERYHQVENVGP